MGQGNEAQVGCGSRNLMRMVSISRDSFWCVSQWLFDALACVFTTRWFERQGVHQHK